MRAPLLVYLSASEPREGEARSGVGVVTNVDNFDGPLVQLDDDSDDDLDRDEDDEDDDFDDDDSEEDEEDEEDDEPETWQVSGP